MNIKFEKLTTDLLDTVFEWLAEPHMIEFWDNTQEHKDDIMNFVYNRPQTYFAGTTKYWVGIIDDKPYSFILSDILTKGDASLSQTQVINMSETGHTIAIDFGIGNKDYLGKGLAAATLSEFMIFYKRDIDQKADTFFIDPDENNPRAIRVYNKAGFNKVGQYKVTHGAFIGNNSDLMIKKLYT